MSESIIRKGEPKEESTILVMPRIVKTKNNKDRIADICEKKVI